MTDAATDPHVYRLADLRGPTNPLAEHYRHFRVAERLLLTGHSHQAWPDCSAQGQQHAWADAAELVDRKWDRAFAKAERVRQGWRELLDDAGGEIALGANTHELVVRFLSGLPLTERPRLVTTDGEFHTLRRQLDRLAEAGLEVVKLAAEPVADLAERTAAAIDDRTAAAMISCVMFRNAQIVPGLDRVAAACDHHGAALLIDAYHALNVVPWSLREVGLERAYVVGGGYKYCQLGEGNCFLRLLPGCDLRPVVTGWYSEFATLADAPPGGVAYGAGAARFAGATYDPTAHYRAAEVFDFFARHRLTPQLLREVSQHQVGLLIDTFDGLDLDPAIVTRDRAVALEHRAGFLSLRSPQAAELNRGLARRGVTTDYRDDLIRFGPAPYLSDSQLREAMSTLRDAALEIGP